MKKWNPTDRTDAVTVELAAPLRGYVGGSMVQCSAGSVRGILMELEKRYPELYVRICDETGKVRRHVNVFVSVGNIRDRDGLESPVVPGDRVTVLPSVSGG